MKEVQWDEQVIIANPVKSPVLHSIKSQSADLLQKAIFASPTRRRSKGSNTDRNAQFGVSMEG